MTAPDDLMKRLMMLGAFLAGTQPGGARIVAEALAEIESLRKRLAESEDAAHTGGVVVRKSKRREIR